MPSPASLSLAVFGLRDAFATAMKTVDVTFQNLDSSEISLTGGCVVLVYLSCSWGVTCEVCWHHCQYGLANDNVGSA